MKVIKTPDNPYSGFRVEGVVNQKTNGYCANCGEEIRPLLNAEEIPVHTYSEKRTCESGKTMAEYRIIIMKKGTVDKSCNIEENVFTKTSVPIRQETPITREKLIKIFNEWQKRWETDPSDFDETYGDDYAEKCADYFLKLMKEVK